MVLLLVRSHGSFLTAPCSPRALCEEAVRLGHGHLVLVDGNGLYAYPAFAAEARRLGLQALFGVELVRGARRLVAVARDGTGYASLCRLVTALQLDRETDLAFATARHQQGLWVLCADPQLLLALHGRVDRERLRVLLPPAGERPAPPPGGRPAPGQRKAPDPAPPPRRRALVEAAEVLELPLVAGWDVWYARPEDAPTWSLVMAVKWNRAAGTPQPPGHHLPGPDEPETGFADHPGAVAEAERVRAACTLAFAADAPPVFPACEVPAGRDAAGHLRVLAEEGLRRRYGTPAPAVRDRLQRELGVITAMGFAPYFLVVRRIAALAWERGIPAVGRGSAADSLVAYCLGLTDADPVRHGLLFERFLNPARRGDRPDIDLDFCWRRRDELLEAVYDHFGRDRVAMIATFNTCGPRAAYGEAAKAAGLPPAEVARRTKLLPWHRREGVTLLQLVTEAPGFHRRGSTRPAAEEEAIVRGAEALLQAPRHLGVHPGGLVITPDPIAGHVPLERAAKGLVVTQYDMHFVEDLGLVKIDLLGNRALTIVADTLAHLRALGEPVPDLAALPEDEPRTAALVREGRTLGCFQVESPAMRSLLRQMEAGCTERVVQAIALVRPGPAAAGMKEAFVRRCRGLEPVRAAPPLLAEVFADTFGIMLYQEDVIRAAMAVAGMDGGAGDELRRHLGAVHGGDRDRQDAFVVAGLRRGLPRAAIEQVWAEMARFAGYSFCKAHAVTYGRIAWQCCHLKAHHPAAFLAALLANDAGYFAKGVYVEEAKRLGIRVLRPCVHRSGEDFTVERWEGRPALRVGLREVRRVGERTRRRLREARAAGGSFRDVEDFLQRVRPERDEAEHLVLCGALDDLGGTRPELLWRLQVARRRPDRLDGGGELIAGVLAPAPLRFPALPEYGPERRTRLELELLGFALDAHPVDVLWRGGGAGGRGAVPCGALEEHPGRRVALVGWIVALRRHRGGGRPMAFVTFEDGTGVVEATVFPAVYERFGAHLHRRGPFRVEGIAEERLGGVALRLLSLHPVSGGEKPGPAELD